MPPNATILAALHGLPSMTPRTLRILLEYFDLADFSDWQREDLIKTGVEAERASLICQDIQTIDLSGISERLQQISVHVLSKSDPGYPANLREIASPPPLLYVRGNTSVLAAPALAVVGTRLPTHYGLAVTPQLISPVAQHGITIVSGLALGIDGLAHQTAIQDGGKTVAVLGSGIDVLYPWQHQDLAEEIIATGGAILSEFPLGAQPERHHFPQRNRVIAGLAKATLLIEAGEKSGALITAKFALDANREVLAVPGPVTSPQSVGPNNWIRLGATLVRSPADILEIFQPSTAHLPIPHSPNPNPDAPTPTPNPPSRTSPDQEKLYAFLSHEPTHIDVLVEKSRLHPSVVSAALALLEINGIVRQLGGQFYIRS